MTHYVRIPRYIYQVIQVNVFIFSLYITCVYSDVCFDFSQGYYYIVASISSRKVCPSIFTSSSLKSLGQLNMKLVNLGFGERSAACGIEGTEFSISIFFICALHRDMNFRGTAQGMIFSITYSVFHGFCPLLIGILIFTKDQIKPYIVSCAASFTIYFKLPEREICWESVLLGKDLSQRFDPSECLWCTVMFGLLSESCKNWELLILWFFDFFFH